MSFRKGMAGLVLLVLVLGYMMAISTSSTMMIQTEAIGKSARQGYKNAYYAAVAGIGTVMAELRKNPAYTFDVSESNRPYFTRVAADTNNHHCTWTSTNKTYTGYTRLKAPGWISISSPFTLNTEIDNSQYLFTICSYPATASSNVYYVKSQGKFADASSDKVFYAQVWAIFNINPAAKLLSLTQFGTMGVATLTLDTTSGQTNDFWDWQHNFN